MKTTALLVLDIPVKKKVIDLADEDYLRAMDIFRVPKEDAASHPVTNARKYSYRAFGEQITEYEAPGTGEDSSYVPNPFGFTGRETEFGTDLYHYRNRSYDPMNGRFISSDPYYSMVMMGQGLSNASAGGFNPLMMGTGNCGAGCGMNSLTANSGTGISTELARLLINPQSLNAFGYVMGNPLLFKDPWGLIVFEQSVLDEFPTANYELELLRLIVSDVFSGELLEMFLEYIDDPNLKVGYDANEAECSPKYKAKTLDGNTISVTSSWGNNPIDRISTLVHEMMHIHQKRTQPILYYPVTYLPLIPLMMPTVYAEISLRNQNLGIYNFNELEAYAVQAYFKENAIEWLTSQTPFELGNN